MTTLEWGVYFINLINGVRCYLNKKDPNTMKAARRKNKILFASNVVLQLALYLSLGVLTAVIVGCPSIQLIDFCANSRGKSYNSNDSIPN